MKEKLKQLRQPLPAKLISWRVGAQTADKGRGQALPYIDARVVQNLLDDIVGPENWQTQFLAPNNGSVICNLSILVDGAWVTKSDAAEIGLWKEGDAGGKELQVKGAYSDAFKRAAVMWGIGRYLYAFAAPWVSLSERGHLLGTPTLPDEFLPPEERSGKAVTQDVAPAPAPAAPSQPMASESVEQPVAEQSAVEQPAPAPAPVEAEPTVEAAAEKPAVPAGDPLADDARVAAHESLVDRLVAAEQSAEAPVAAPAAAPATQEQPAANDNLARPAGMTAEEEKLVKDLEGRIHGTKFSVSMIRNYVMTGPKCKELLSEASRSYLLALLDKRKAAA